MSTASTDAINTPIFASSQSKNFRQEHNRYKNSCYFLAERAGFEPAIRCRIHDFESCTFNHSATSPCTDNYTPLYLFLLIMLNICKLYAYTLHI